MSAVLEDALRVFRRYATSTSRRDRELFDEVREWFAADEDGWPFSFVNICEVLGLSAARIRLALAQIASVPPRGASLHQHRVETDHVTVSRDAGNLRTGTSAISAQ